MCPYIGAEVLICDAEVSGQVCCRDGGVVQQQHRVHASKHNVLAQLHGQAVHADNQHTRRTNAEWRVVMMR